VAASCERGRYEPSGEQKLYSNYSLESYRKGSITVQHKSKSSQRPQSGHVTKFSSSMKFSMANAVPLESDSRGTQDHIFFPPTVQTARNGGPGSRIKLRRNRVAVIPPELGSLSVASHDSQGYGGHILTRLHTDD
jgi:hypothetical protein